MYVGGGLSSLSIAMAEGVGWRMSAFIVAAYGLLLSLFVRLTIKEPVRSPSSVRTVAQQEDSDAEKDYSVKDR